MNNIFKLIAIATPIAIAGALTFAAADTPAKSIAIDQKMDSASLHKFHHMDQGTRLVPAAWLAAFDTADGTQKFMSRDNMERLGFIVDDKAADTSNPYGWPVGFTVSDPKLDGGIAMAGFTCAACHTGQIERNGTTIRIEGGQAMIDLEGFLRGMVGAFGATVADPARRAEFIKRAVEAGYPFEKIESDLVAASGAFAKLSQSSAGSGITMVETGRGRMDAVQGIANRVFGDDLMTPANKKNMDSPASIPYLWDIWKLSWVQYNGFLPGLNSTGRNIGEVLGVYGKVNFLDAKTGELNSEPLRWKSSIQLDNLVWMEKALHNLQAPSWPEEVLGPIDQEKAKRGKELFTANCSGCHGIKVLPNGIWDVTVVPLKHIGTDPNATTGWASFTYDGSKLGLSETTKVFDGLPVAINALRKQLYAENNTPAEDQEPDVEFEAPCGYKARPLIGVWSTPPFLHNGSVRTVYDLLSDTRPGKFTFGSREYDPEKLGYTEDPSAGSIVLDTSIPGNSNAGHWWTDDLARPGRIGPRLADADKYALIEFLKDANYENYPSEPRAVEATMPCQDNKNWADAK